MAESYIQLPSDGTGKKTRTWNETMGSDSVHNQYVIIRDCELVTYHITTSTVTAAATTHMLSIFNGVGSGYIVKIRNLEIFPFDQASSDPKTFSLYRTTAQSGGTSITPVKADLSDADLSASILLAKGVTAANLGTLTLMKFITATASQPNAARYQQEILSGSFRLVNDYIYKPIKLREGQGVSIRNDVALGSGSTFDVNAIITVE